MVFRRIFREYVVIENRMGLQLHIKRNEWVNLTQKEREKYILIGSPENLGDYFMSCMLSPYSTMVFNREKKEV